MKKRFKKAYASLFTLTMTGLLALAGCGGGGGGSGSSDVTMATGKFIDSSVQGVSYVSGSHSGVTTADGSFTYEVGKTVKFTIGAIVLGEVTAKGVITPLDLVPTATSVSAPAVQNITRFLMTLDSDNNPDNGITISPTTITAAQSAAPIDFATATDSTLTSALASLTTNTLVTTTAADTHLTGSLLSLYAGAYSGTFSGTEAGTWSLTIDANGVITGTATPSNGGTMTLSGQLDPTNGNMTFSSTGTVSNGVSFTGTVDVSTGVFSGTWIGGSSTGTFTGTKSTANGSTTGGTTGTATGTVTNPLVGTWYVANSSQGRHIAITFFGDGTYMHAEDGIADASGQTGIERGTFTSTANTFTVTNVAVDQNGTWGLSDSLISGPVAYTISGNQMQMGGQTFTKAVDASNPLVGSWYADNTSGTGSRAIITFFSDGVYMQAENVVSDPCGSIGMERGTYTSTASAFTINSIPVDTNGCAGLSDVLGTPVSYTISGNQLTLPGATLPFARVQ